MKVTIENYTQMALRTWGGENQKERAKLGIIGELGEVAEVLKKYLRGDFDEVERDKRLLKELGDFLYYIAINMHLDKKDFKYTFNNSIAQIGSDIFDLHEFCLYSNEYSVADRIIGFLRKSGFTLEQVMQANIEKLSSRADRGKINGDGDNR